ncbi:nuclear transport factor 2 family protein [Chitinophaga agri]|uniref:Nuclear transport factor 2 family protein n=1 Tax=Chitinophaga agri TaxID=2703787 RepID=A0A6B9ZIM7_9BACT|nr:nuclear transport factor 2 family protein [Chitinophaga agri]QHS62248.1 nuclear transport factor 2 family protein [Chitinophaga agri]
MTTLKENVHTLNNLIISHDTLKAMELFYAHDVQMQENEDSPRQGKEACIEHEKMILDLFDLDYILIDQAINEAGNVVFSEWEMNFTNKETGKSSKRIQVSVQHWHEGLIESEKFYYNRSPKKM